MNDDRRISITVVDGYFKMVRSRLVVSALSKVIFTLPPFIETCLDWRLVSAHYMHVAAMLCRLLELPACLTRSHSHLESSYCVLYSVHILIY